MIGLSEFCMQKVASIGLVAGRVSNYRKACALHAELSNDYEEAQVKWLEYKFGSNPIDQVEKALKKLVERRKYRMDNAKKYVDRCIQLCNFQADTLKGKGKSAAPKADAVPKANTESSSNDGSNEESDHGGERISRGGRRKKRHRGQPTGW